MSETSSPERGLRIEMEDARAELGSDEIPDLVTTVQHVLVGENVASGSVSLYLVDPDEMTALNVQHMGGTGPTDVLSFPMDDPDMTQSAHNGHQPHLGEIVICVDVAQRQAPSHAGSLEAELQLLSVHGTLHLLGYDHAEETDRAKMQGLEAQYLSVLGLQHPGDHR